MYSLPSTLSGERWNRTGFLLLWLYSKFKAGQVMSVSGLADELCMTHAALCNKIVGREPEEWWFQTALLKLRRRGYPELVLMELDGVVYPDIAWRLEGDAEIIYRGVGATRSGGCSSGGD